MSGGGNTTGSLQNFPLVPNSDAAQASGAGAAPQAQSVSQLQQILQRMGAGRQGGGGMGAQSPLQQMTGLGQNMMRMQPQQPMGGAPMMRPMGSPSPMQAPVPPQMNAQQGMTPGLMNLALMRQNGML